MANFTSPLRLVEGHGQINHAAQLSKGRGHKMVPKWSQNFSSQKTKNYLIEKYWKNGAPDRIRTCDLCLRRATLYPAELRVQRRSVGSPDGRWIQHRLGSRGGRVYGLLFLACHAFIWLISRS